MTYTWTLPCRLFLFRANGSSGVICASLQAASAAAASSQFLLTSLLPLQLTHSFTINVNVNVNLLGLAGRPSSGAHCWSFRRCRSPGQTPGLELPQDPPPAQSLALSALLERPPAAPAPTCGAAPRTAPPGPAARTRAGWASCSHSLPKMPAQHRSVLVDTCDARAKRNRRMGRQR